MRFDLGSVRADFGARIAIVQQLLDATRLTPAGSVRVPGLPDVSREARGLAIVLLYASYEALLRSIARSLLESAVRIRAGNRRLQPGFQVVAVFPKLQAVAALPKESHIWRRAGLELVHAAFSGRPTTIDETRFPDIGDSFRRSQVAAVCTLFGLGDPAPVLREVWDRLDTIVVQRNGVAHGGETATDLGGRYSDTDLTVLVGLWQLRWGEFIDWVETAGRARELYRRPR